jgi:hypothetical protein
MRAFSASMNACPVAPTPGASKVPRANTTSTAGHGVAGSADATPAACGPITAATDMAAAAQPRTRVRVLLDFRVLFMAQHSRRTLPGTSMLAPTPLDRSPEERHTC